MLLEGVGRLLVAAGLRPVPRRLAGHSKWANIRHIKAQKDGERSLKFSRLSRLMRASIAEGGADPTQNHRLDSLIEQARAINMPKSSIEAVFKKSNDESQSKPATIEVVGPGGSCLLVELLTDNTKRTTYTIATFLRKCGARLGHSGQAKHAFASVGIVVTDGGDLDQATEDAIEAGAEDVELQQEADGESVLVFTTPPLDVFKVRKGLQGRNYTIQSAEMVYLPQKEVTLNEADAKLYQTLILKLNEVHEVVRVTSNVEEA